MLSILYTHLHLCSSCVVQQTLCAHSVAFQMAIALVVLSMVVTSSPFHPSTRLGSSGGKDVVVQVQVATVRAVVVPSEQGPVYIISKRLVTFILRSPCGVPISEWHQDGGVHDI